MTYALEPRATDGRRSRFHRGESLSAGTLSLGGPPPTMPSLKACTYPSPGSRREVVDDLRHATVAEVPV